jgi:hypothetical protein
MSDNIPSDPRKLAELKAAVVDGTHIQQEIDMKKEALKDHNEAIADTFGIPKKIVNKLVRTMYKQEFATLQQENEEFAQLYESMADASFRGNNEAA